MTSHLFYTGIYTLLCLLLSGLIGLLFFWGKSPSVALNQMSWSATASHNAPEVHLAFDHDVTTPWTSQIQMEPGMFFQLDLGRIIRIIKIEIDLGGASSDFPENFQIVVSTDGVTWKSADTRGFLGDIPLLKIFIEPVFTRYIKIVQTGAPLKEKPWSIHEIHIYHQSFLDVPYVATGALIGVCLLLVITVYAHVSMTGSSQSSPKYLYSLFLLGSLLSLVWLHEIGLFTRPERITDTGSWKVTASHNPEETSRAFDSWHETRWTTGQSMQPGMFFLLDLGTQQTIKKIFLNARSIFTAPRGYRIDVSQDAQTWNTVLSNDTLEVAVRKSFLPVQARYVRITQTGKTQTHQEWSIHELHIYRATSFSGLALISLAGLLLLAWHIQGIFHTSVFKIGRSVIIAACLAGTLSWALSLSEVVREHSFFHIALLDYMALLSLCWRIMLYVMVVKLLWVVGYSGLVSKRREIFYSFNLFRKSAYEAIQNNTLFRNVSARFHPQNAWMLFIKTSLRLHLFLLLIGSLLIIYNHLGERSLESADEGIHTRVANTIVNTGRWWPLEYKGEPYTQKPPLKLWLSALTFRFIGNTEFWVRFWDATFAMFTIWTIYILGRVTFTPVAGFMGAGVLLLSRNYLYNHCARTGVQDSAMIFFFTLALVLFWFRNRHRAFYYLAGIAMSGTSLTKNWMGIGPLVIVVGYLILSREFTELKRKPFYIMVGLSLLLPSLWFLPNVIWIPGYFERSFVKNMVGRMTGTTHSKFTQDLWFYANILYRYFSPWWQLLFVVLPFSLWKAFAKHEKIFLFLLVWGGVIFGGFSMAKLKLGWYINPVFPPLALLIGASMYGIFVTLQKTLSQKAPVLIVGLIIIFISLFGSTFVTLYQRSTMEREKYPLQLFTYYLESWDPDAYQVVLYQIDEDTQLNNYEHYYFNRLRRNLFHIDSMKELHTFLKETTKPTFVALTRKMLLNSSFPLKSPEGIQYFLPVSKGIDKSVLVYHYTPEHGFPLTRRLGKAL